MPEVVHIEDCKWLYSIVPPEAILFLKTTSKLRLQNLPCRSGALDFTNEHEISTTFFDYQ
jgi:hypothetical protein